MRYRFKQTYSAKRLERRYAALERRMKRLVEDPKYGKEYIARMQRDLKYIARQHPRYVWESWHEGPAIRIGNEYHSMFVR